MKVRSDIISNCFILVLFVVFSAFKGPAQPNRCSVTLIGSPLRLRVGRPGTCTNENDKCKYFLHQQMVGSHCQPKFCIQIGLRKSGQPVMKNRISTDVSGSGDSDHSNWISKFLLSMYDMIRHDMNPVYFIFV